MLRPRVIVSLLPKEDQKTYERFLDLVIAALVGTDGLGVTSGDDIRVLLLPDLCELGLGEEIDIDVELPPHLADLGEKAHFDLAARLCEMFKTQYPQAKIQYTCEIRRPVFTYES